MNTSTIEARRGTGRRLGVFILGLAVACAGAFSLSAAKADAAPVEVQFDKGLINLGAAFKGQQILPAPKTVNGARAAYWWDGVDTGFAALAAKTWADTVASGPPPGGFTPPYPSSTAAVNALYSPLTSINLCSTPYAAAPEKPANAPSTANPNVNFPCEVNPSGATVGAQDTAWAGQTPGTCLGTASCFDEVEGVKTVRGWPGPVNTNPLVAPSWSAIAAGIQSGGGPNAALWGDGDTDPNAVGDTPFGFLDMVMPVSDSSITQENSGNYDVKIGANAFRFPLMIVPSPLDGSPVPITLAVTGAPFTPTTAAGKTEDELYVKGTFNPGTGAMSLSGALEARVLVGLGIDAVPESPAYPEDPPDNQKGGPSPFVYCAVPLTGLTLNTTGGATSAGEFPGTPYLDGVDGGGAVTGSFNVSADSTPTVLEPWAEPAKYSDEPLDGNDAKTAPDCTNVNNVVKGKGAIWLGSGDVDVPTCAEDEVGDYPDCKAAEVSFGTPSIKLAKKKVKAGKKIKATVRVKNNGTIEGTASVKVQTSNSRAKAPVVNVKVAADPGSTGRKTVKLSTRKGKKGKVTIYATVGGKTGKATVRVK